MRRILLLTVVLAAALTGCGEDAPRDPGTPGDSRTDLYVANFSAETISAVHVVPAGHGDWEDNWLQAPVAGGDWSAFVGNVVSGRYDIRMVGAFHTVDAFGFAVVGDYIAVTFNPAP